MRRLDRHGLVVGVRGTKRLGWQRLRRQLGMVLGIEAYLLHRKLCSAHINSNADRFSDTDLYSDCDSDEYQYADEDANLHLDIDANTDQFSHANEHPHGDPNTNPHFNEHAHQHQHSHEYSDIHLDADQHSD